MRADLHMRFLRFVVCILLIPSLMGCSSPALRKLAGAEREPASAESIEQAARLHAVLINGGGNKRINYQSHLLHLGQIRDLLLESGVPPDRITVFASDGDDPEPDLALRHVQPEKDFWRLLGTPAHARLRMPLVDVTSEVDGTQLLPATQEAITRWFAGSAATIQPGDTLFVYVTDHGEKNKNDLADNTITLWGKKEHLSVRELDGLLAGLDPKVRVVMLMSQCFSGSFANIINGDGRDKDAAGPEVCGYFSATADRMAYGCYAENRGRENVGHSFRFINALAEDGSLDAAHIDTMVTDATPDVPNRTSDFYVDRLLRAAAEEQGLEYETYVDSLLAEAWGNKARWESQIRLLDRIGKAFGYFSPRSLAELEEQQTRLPDIAGQMKNVSLAWRQTLQDSNAANFRRFITANPDWEVNLGLTTRGGLDQRELRRMTGVLLADLEKFTREDREVADRILTLHKRGDDASATSYRMEVRLAVVLRMRVILTTIAGQVYLETRADVAQAERYRALVACEDLRIPPAPRMAGRLETPERFPPFKEDVERATAALPAWMGIRFRDVQPPAREKLGLEAGAARVLTVYPGAPADQAGLATTDVVTGPPGKPFTEPRQIRSWTMLSPIGTARELDVIDIEGVRRTVSLVPGPYPLEWPKLPGPPEIGAKAPSIKLSDYQGDAAEALSGGPYMLFFWATWCGPCKAAIPDLLEFERSGAGPVIAITDEPAELLDAFFAEDREFPSIIAIDPFRQAFQTYGVSGTPTFVLVDGDGAINSQFSGYSKEKGLGEAARAMMAVRRSEP